MIGGGAREPLWCQMLADVLGVDVEAFRNADIMPAVALAAIVFADPCLPRSCRRTVTYTPDPQAAAVYGRAYPRFLRLYPALAPLAR
ncbi:FGGY-family carbohydrate kinase [Bifidobacterium pullorum]|uniref:FGGY-family carbohydrate kinase n=1 Tax=Bifidobacterium pullorum TaxID=78448 RepID=UPI003F7C6290